MEDVTDGGARDNLSANSFIVGGASHRELVSRILKEAKSHVIIHSCFVHPKVVEGLLPEMEEAAKRGVRVDLLWGLRIDPEDANSGAPISDTQTLLAKLQPAARQKIQLSAYSSGSHAKVVIYDDKVSGRWNTVISSCNFLSTWFEAIDVSLATGSRVIAREVLGQLIATQVPSVGAWPSVARRLREVWQKVRLQTRNEPDIGDHRLELIVDEDHYACVTAARDGAAKRIVIGCDLFGLSAQTSVIVPMETAAQGDSEVKLYYNRASKALSAEGRSLDDAGLASKGIDLAMADNLHG
jgi:hypothetical protein